MEFGTAEAELSGSPDENDEDSNNVDDGIIMMVSCALSGNVVSESHHGIFIIK